MKRQFLKWGSLCLAISLFASCSKNDSQVTEAEPENEPMTTVVLTAVNNSDLSDTSKASWTLNPDTNVEDTANWTLHLKANTSYTTKIDLIDSSQNPPEDIIDEIWDRRNYHLFFLQPSPMAKGFEVGVNSPYIPEDEWDTNYESNAAPYLNLAVSRQDHDDNTPALPVGITDKFTTGTSSSGYLRVVLRHQPNVKDGTWAGSKQGGGSTDIDSRFRVSIQ